MRNLRALRTRLAEAVPEIITHAEGTGPPLHAPRSFAFVRRNQILCTKPGGITTTGDRYAVQKRMNGVQNPRRLPNMYSSRFRRLGCQYPRGSVRSSSRRPLDKAPNS